MSETKQIRLLGFIKIKGQIEALTGLHIGGTSDSIDKGGIDNPVIKNPVTNEPYIPGSSLRGRMRSLLEKKTGALLTEMTKNIWVEMHKKLEDAQKSPVCRVFGNSSSEPGLPSVLVVRDAMLNDKSKDLYMYDRKLPITEAKLEIVVDRITAAAMPRTIERVPAGAKFNFEVIYNVQTYEDGKFVSKGNYDTRCDEKLRQDIKSILWALETIQEHTGLGGNTSRGHGQVKIHLDSMEAKTVDGDIAKGFKNPDNKDFKSYKDSVANLSYAIQQS